MNDQQLNSVYAATVKGCIEFMRKCKYNIELKKESPV